MTAMIGIGLMATPIAVPRMSPIAGPMTDSFPTKNAEIPVRNGEDGLPPSFPPVGAYFEVSSRRNSRSAPCRVTPMMMLLISRATAAVPTQMSNNAIDRPA